MVATTITEAGAHLGPGQTTQHVTRLPLADRRRLSWGAVLSGVVIIVAVQIVLSLLGAGVGLGTVDTNAGTTPSAGSIGIGAALWWIVSSCLALAAGAYAAAWLSGAPLRSDGALHGLVAWAIATVLTLWLLTSAMGNVISGGYSALRGVATAAGSGVSQPAKPLAQAAGVSPDAMQEQVQSYLQPANDDPASMTPQDAQKHVAKDLVTFTEGGTDAGAARERIINVMAAQMKVSHDQAAKQFDDAQAKLKQSRDQAIQTAKNAADASASAASKAAFAAFGVLLLGAIAAAYAGSFGARRNAFNTEVRPTL